MKKYTIFWGFIFCFCNVFAQCKIKDILPEVYQQREFFFQKEIPRKFKFIYQGLIDNADLIVSHLINEIGTVVVPDTMFIMESYGSTTGKIGGNIWGNTISMEYVIYGNDGKFEKKNVKKKKSAARERLIQEICKWSDEMHDRSFYASITAGAPYIIVSRVITRENLIQVDSEAFCEYDPQDDYIYHKEKEEDNYQTKTSWRTAL